MTEGARALRRALESIETCIAFRDAQQASLAGALPALWLPILRVAITTESGAELLLIGGVLLNEPVARYGPFVMNTDGEIRQAMLDYQSGRFGQIG